MAELWGDSLPARGLARSVAHRLKYYIDVKRKEDSFDSSGVIRDETELSSLYMNDNKQLEHDFAEIKLEAYLRAYMGSANECIRKVQKNAGRLKGLEKQIKKMAQDYVPDKTNEGRGKHAKRQKRSPITSVRLHATATPLMSPEEVRRLVSSASKLIVAATSEASSKEPGTPQEGVLSPEGRDTQNIQHLGDSSTQCPPFTCSHKEEAEAIQEYSEEHIVEAGNKCLETNGRKKSNRTKEDRHAKDIRRPTGISSEISSKICKSERAFSRCFPTPSDSRLRNAGFTTPYLQTGQNEACRKSRARRTPSRVSEHLKKERKVQWKKTSPSQQNAETGQKAFDCERQKSVEGPIGTVGSIRSRRSGRHLETQPILSSRNPPAVKGHNRKVHSAKLVAEMIHAEGSTVGEKAGMSCNSAVVSESLLLKGQTNNTSNQLDQSHKLVKTSPKHRQNLEQDSKRNLEGQRVRFQKLPHESIPGTVEWKHHGLDGWSAGDSRAPFSDQPMVAESRCPELVRRLQEDQKKETDPPAVNGSSFLYQVCQGMDQEAPPSSALNRTAKTDGSVKNGRPPHLLNRLFLLNEPGGGQAMENPAGSMNESCDWQTASSPSVTVDICRCSEPPDDCASKVLGEHGSGCPFNSVAIWSDDLAEDEFTISSASCSSSGTSLDGTQEQKNGNANVDLEKEEQNADFSTETLVQKILNMMQDDSATQEIFRKHHEKLGSPDEEDETDKDCGNGNSRVSQVVYFSQLPP